MTTQAEVDQAYNEWMIAAKTAPCGGTPAVEALWQRFCRLDDELAAESNALDRVNINRALAKAIAYHDCNKPEEAQRWAIQLMRELQQRQIIRPELDR